MPVCTKKFSDKCIVENDEPLLFNKNNVCPPCLKALRASYNKKYYVKKREQILAYHKKRNNPTGKKKAGRPKGSKNKVKNNPPKKRGRPKGSKNKPKNQVKDEPKVEPKVQPE